MAETIKGINVAIGAETTGLSAALSDVNKKSRDIQSELKQVEKLLKLDPSNTELLAQKQKLLSDAVANTSEKLKRLKTAQQQVADQFARGEISEGQYRAFQREVAKAEQELRGFEDKLQSIEPELKSFVDKAKEAGDKLKGIGDGMKDVGEKMSIGITAPMAGIVALATEGTEEFRKFMSRLDTNAQQAGVSLDVVHDAMRDLNAITGETDSNVEAISQLIATGLKGDAFKQTLEALTGAAIKFSDTLKIEGLADGLQETLATGAAVGPFAELLERSGVSLDKFNAGLSEASKNGQQQQFILQQLADLGLAKVNEEYRKNNEALVENANAQYDMQAALADLGKTLTPIITALSSKLAELLGWFNGLDGGTQKVILAIAGITAAIGPAILVIGHLITGVSAIVGAFSAASGAIAAAGGIMAVITGPVGIVIAIVAALAAAAYLIIKNWDPISKFFIDLWASISSATSTAWESIKGFFSGLWAWVKGFFTEWGPTILAVIAPFIGIPLLIYQHWDEISAFFSKLWDGIVTYLAGVWESMKNAASTAFRAILNVISPILEGFKTFISGIWEAIKNIFAGALLLIIDLVMGDFENLKKDAEAIWNNLKDAFGKIWEGIKQVFSGALNLIKSALSATWDGIKTTAITAWEGIKSAVSSIVTATSSWIKDTWNALLDWFRELPDKLYTIGSDMFTRMRDAVSTTVTTVKDAIVNGITEAIDWLRNLPSTMVELGRDAIQGLINGIKNMIGKVGDAIKSVADKVTGGIRDALGIHSPSRVLMQLGEYTGEGFAKGIGNTVQDVRQQANAMAAAASDVLTGMSSPSASHTASQSAGAGSMSYNFDGMFSGANISIRSDDDIRKMAREIWSLGQQVQRGAGGMRA